jgi:cyclophilin family peptidyl-prolyl cis-trans isomerase
VVFHRIVEDFVAQAGNPSGLGYLGPGYLTEDEIDPNLTFDGEGALAMAKANDDDNGSQFFITIVPSSQLDGNFTIFGQVSEDTFGVLESLPATEGENVSEAEPPFIEEQFFYFYNPGRAGQGRAGQGRAGQGSRPPETSGGPGKNYKGFHTQ